MHKNGRTYVYLRSFVTLLVIGLCIHFYRCYNKVCSFHKWSSVMWYAVPLPYGDTGTVTTSRLYIHNYNVCLGYCSLLNLYHLLYYVSYRLVSAFLKMTATQCIAPLSGSMAVRMQLLLSWEYKTTGMCVTQLGPPNSKVIYVHAKFQSSECPWTNDHIPVLELCSLTLMRFL